ncbi:MAG: restriction endonuclease subunit S [Rhodospirillales bacterium]|nr:restriction endonuclease subunit S [Rhodospirillales bacterium]
MAWHESNFGDFAEFRNGLNFSSDCYGAGTKIIGVADFKDHFVPQYDKLGEIITDGLIKEQNLLKNGDILFVRSNGNKNLVGRSLYIRNLEENVVYSGFCIRARPNAEVVDSLYLAYFCKSDAFRKRVAGAAGGANIQNLSQPVLSRCPVPLPDLPTQKKIAGVLSAYDDLIENNLKRIKLLEELAQITYEEWFVRLRFPGHETTPVNPDTALPEGWEKETLQRHIKFLKGKKVEDISLEYQPGLSKIMLLDSLESGDFKYTSPNKHVRTNRGDLVMCMDGARSSHVFYAEDGIVGSTMAKIASKTIPVSLLYMFFKAHLEWLQINNTGAAIPHANKAFINKIQFLIPSGEILQKWEQYISSINKQIWVLRDQNQRLREARDILLPRLMTGMIDVEDYDPTKLDSRLRGNDGGVSRNDTETEAA